MRTPILTILVLGTAWVASATECLLGPPGDACSHYWQRAAVFVGTVREIRPVPSHNLVSVHFAVERRWRGVRSNTVVVTAEPKVGMNCGMTFQLGQRYIVYADRGPGGELTTAPGRGTRLASDAAADLAFLKEVTGPARGGRIFGSVYRSDDDLVTTGFQDYGAVEGARVLVSGPTRRQVATGPDGNYDVRNLPAGSYTVTITPPQGLTLLSPRFPGEQEPFQVTLTHPHECVDVSVRPRTDSQITGVLIDPSGRPVDGERVDLINAVNAASSDKQIPHRSTQTDPEGRFMFDFMGPGNYLVGVNLKNPPAPSQVDLRTYHPGVSEPARATVVAIEPGSRIQLAPFRLSEPPLERRFSGTIVWSDGTPVLDARLEVTGASPEEIPVDAGGRFTLTLPLGAQFTLSARAPLQVKGRREMVTSRKQHIGRYDRGGDITIVLNLPR